MPRPLTPAEAADLAMVVGHPRFASLSRCNLGWLCDIYGTATTISRRTIRAALRAAVRWIEENP